MGRASAIDMKDSVDHGDIPVEQAIIWHMQYNHYPPYPESFTKVAVRIVNGLNDGSIKMTDEVTELKHRETGKHPQVIEVVQSFHLGDFIDYEREVAR